MLEFMRVVATRLGTRARVLLAQLRGAGNEGDDDDAEPFDDAEVVHPAGYLARPPNPATTVPLVHRDGDEAVVIALVDKGLGVVNDLAIGEVRITGVSAANVVAALRILASGQFTITSKTGTPIHLYGAEQTSNMKPVAHEGSLTTGHVHTETGVGLRAGWLPVVGTSASATDTVATGAGSANVLVPDT
jgi:hypothetical protein